MTMHDAPDDDKGSSLGSSTPQDSNSNNSGTSGIEGNKDSDSNNRNNSNNISLLRLEIPESLSTENIVEEFTLNSKWYFSLKLNHKNDRKTIIFQFNKDYAKFLELTKGRLHSKGLDEKHVTMLTDTLDNNNEKILEFLTNCEAEFEAEQDRNSTAEKAFLVAIGNCGELFIDDDSGTSYAAIKVRQHIETVPLDGGRFRNWLCKLFYDQSNSVLNSDAATNAINLLKAEAEFNCGTGIGSTRRKKLNLRTAAVGDDVYFYDLTNPEWEVIRITADNWSIEKNPPIIFKRYSNQLPQVYPSREYPPDVLDRFMGLTNVKDEENKLLLKCYLISLFIPEIPKPILILHGEQGSAKTTLQELNKMLIDPSIIKTLTFPTRIDELTQQLSHNLVAVYDNVSIIKRYISDHLCRAVTGGGFSKRRLYTDDDDFTYRYMRAIWLNGINLAATEPDLLDRGLTVELQRIPKDRVRKIADIWTESEKIRPQVLGYIFDILVKVLKLRQGKRTIELKEHPRMADFAEFAELIARCMGYSDGQFLEAYYKNIELQNHEALESNPIAVAVLSLMDNGAEEMEKTWKGTATKLLGELDEIAIHLKINAKSRVWPKSANALSRRLNEVKTNLREVGIEIDRQKDNATKARIIIIKRIKKGPPTEESAGPKHESDEFSCSCDHERRESNASSENPIRIDATSSTDVRLPRENPRVSSPSLYRPRDEIHAYNQGKNGHDISANTDTISTQISSRKNIENHAQIQPLITRDDRDDICRASSTANQNNLKDRGILNSEGNRIESSSSYDNDNTSDIKTASETEKNTRVECIRSDKNISFGPSVSIVNGKYVNKNEVDSEDGIRKKEKEVGLPAIQCIFCDYRDSIEFDLVTHYVSKHQPDLFKLSIDADSVELRAECVVEVSRQKLMKKIALHEEDN